MNNSEFRKWRSSLPVKMDDLTFASPDDTFIFTRFTAHSPLNFDSKQILFADNLTDAIGYIRRIFLYDILNDVIDDLQFDFKSPFDDKQKDAISILHHLHKSGKILSAPDSEKINQFCDSFNSEFSHRAETEYEIHILKDADALRNFLILNFSEYDGFDKEKLMSICNNDLFAGKLLKDFIDRIFK